MFEGLFQPMHLIILLGILLLVFGPKKLPELGKGLGEAIRGFKKGLNETDREKPETADADKSRSPEGRNAAP